MVPEEVKTSKVSKTLEVWDVLPLPDPQSFENFADLYCAHINFNSPATI